MFLEILPLAITMVAGPQILTSIVLVTNKQPVKVSLAYLAGILLAVSTGLTAAFTVARLIGLHAAANGHAPAKSETLEIILVSLLILLSLKSFAGRKTSKPPKWLLGLEEAKPGGAFKIGVLLICLMPGDLIVMTTVGIHLAGHGIYASDIWQALPFVGLTMLLAAIPLLGYVLFRGPAERAMPKLQRWMGTNSWLVNIIVYLFFIFLVLGG